MTPEQRAAEVVGILGRRGHWLNQEVEDRVAAAIRAAVEAERERCARIETAARGLLTAIGEAESMKGPPSVVIAIGRLVAVLEGVTITDEEIEDFIVNGPKENTNAPVDPER